MEIPLGPKEIQPYIAIEKQRREDESQKFREMMNQERRERCVETMKNFNRDYINYKCGDRLSGSYQSCIEDIEKLGYKTEWVNGQFVIFQ
jgi:Mg2+ and Co2+ transporter CorA